MADPILAGAGLVSPLGLGLSEHAFYSRASVMAPPPAAFETREGDRLEVLHCGFLGATAKMGDRLSRLAEIAAHQALAPWEAAGGPGGLAVALVTPVRAGIGKEDVALVRDRVARRAKAAVVQAWPGAAGAFAALAQAQAWLDAGEIPAVLVVAADSHISIEALSDYQERRDSVFCPRTPPPAEGAAALLLTSRERARRLGLEGASLAAAGTATGQGTDDDDAILDGRALTSLIAGLPASRIDLVSGQEQVNDLRKRDFALAHARTAGKLADPVLVTLEEEAGQLGAAAGIAALAFGAGLLKHKVYPNLAPDATMLAWAISPDGTRGVVLARGGETAAMTAAHGAPRVSALDPAARERLGGRAPEAGPSPAAGDAASAEEAAGEEAEGDGPPVMASLPADLLAAANDVLGGVTEPSTSPAGEGERPVKLRDGKGEPVSLSATYAEIAAACLDGIAMAACHRMTLGRERRTREEERILAFTDALLATPRFVSCLSAWWEEAVDSPDPWKVWAPVFVLGGLRGDDVAEGLAGVLRAVPEEEAETAVIAGDALAVAASPERLAWVAALAKDPHPCGRAVALWAHSILGGLSAEALLGVLAKEESRAVRWAAVQAAARGFSQDRRVDEMLLAEVHRAPDADFLWEVLRALALRGHATGYHAMRHDPALLSRLGGRALDVLAFFGDAGDAALARSIVARCGPTKRVLSGLGRYGHPGAAPLLLRALGDEDQADDAAEALVWLFGEPLGEEDLESPDAWRRWLRTTRFPEDTRLRFGKPYSPACVAEVAEAGARSQLDVSWMVDEAHVRCGLSGAPLLSGWSPAADAALAPALSVLAREAGPFEADPWRSVTRSRRGAR